MRALTLLLSPKTECQRSVNEFGCSMLDNETAVRRYKPIIKGLAVFVGKNGRDYFANTSYK